MRHQGRRRLGGGNDVFQWAPGDGNDTVDASGLGAGRMALTINGGLGIDTLIVSSGNDLFNGGDGNDTALMGAGDDRFVWNPGDDDDTLEG